jgi:hypothetical protein
MKATRNIPLIKFFSLTILAVGLSAGLLSAEEFGGQFTLPFEIQWGETAIPAGDYTLILDTAVNPYMVTVREKLKDNVVMRITTVGRNAWSPSDNRSALVLVRTGGKGAVRSLRLSTPGVELNYAPPKAIRTLIAQGPVLIQRIPVYKLAQ